MSSSSRATGGTGGGTGTGTGSSSSRMSDNAQARAALAARRRRRDQHGHQQQQKQKPTPAARSAATSSSSLGPPPPPPSSRPPQQPRPARRENTATYSAAATAAVGAAAAAGDGRASSSTTTAAAATATATATAPPPPTDSRQQQQRRYRTPSRPQPQHTDSATGSSRRGGGASTTSTTPTASTTSAAAATAAAPAGGAARAQGPDSPMSTVKNLLSSLPAQLSAAGAGAGAAPPFGEEEEDGGGGDEFRIRRVVADFDPGGGGFGAGRRAPPPGRNGSGPERLPTAAAAIAIATANGRRGGGGSVDLLHDDGNFHADGDADDDDADGENDSDSDSAYWSNDDDDDDDDDDENENDGGREDGSGGVAPGRARPLGAPSAHYHRRGHENDEKSGGVGDEDDDDDDGDDDYDAAFLGRDEPDSLDATCIRCGSTSSGTLVVVRSTGGGGGGGGWDGVGGAPSAVTAVRSAPDDDGGGYMSSQKQQHEQQQQKQGRRFVAIAASEASGGSAERVLSITREGGGDGDGDGDDVGIGCGQQQRQQQQQQHPPDDASVVLRYGDVISLRSAFAMGRALGVRRVRQRRRQEEEEGGGTATTGTDATGDNGGDDDGGGPSGQITHEVGYYRTVLGSAERWEVLPSSSSGGRGRWIAVGPNAAGIDDTGVGGDGSSSKGRRRRRRRAVRSGEPVVLRNVSTGGLLSLNRTTVASKPSPCSSSLSIVTTSYQTTDDGVGAGTGGGGGGGGGRSTEYDQTTLLDFLHRQDRVRPSAFETFRLVHSSVPPCPSWSLGSTSGAGAGAAAAAGEGGDEARPYLDGTYLLHPGRDDDLPGGPIQSLFRPDYNDERTAPRPTTSPHPEPLGNQPVQIQEQILLDEILGTMMGLEGRYIRARPCPADGEPPRPQPHRPNRTMEDAKFAVASHSTIGGTGIDPTLRHLLDRILPLASSYVRVNSFASSRLARYEFGTVAHALGEAMDVLLQEYLSFCAQMEAAYMRGRGSGAAAASSLSFGSANAAGLTLSKLYVYVQPSLRTMTVLHRVTEVARPRKGGALLNAIRQLMDGEFRGDGTAQDVLRYLLDRASVPYMAMLRGWLDGGGTLHDPYGEFMIERKRVGREGQLGGAVTAAGLGGKGSEHEDWNEWFRVREEHVLSGLLSIRGRDGHGGADDDIVQKVLTAGKYWNAIRLCRRGQDGDHSGAAGLAGGTSRQCNASPNDLRYSMSPIELATYINRCYDAASSTLLSLILREYHLIPTLRIMKRYFLLDQGDFFVHFLDMAEVELLKEMSDVSRGRVQSWLTMSLQPLQPSGSANGGRAVGGAEPTNAERQHPFNTITTSSLRCDFATESLVERLDDLHANSGGIRTQEPRTPSRHLYGAMNRGLTGVEAFMLDFRYIPFPISLILSHRAITNYQLLFRHLFFVKHVERRLVGTWLDHQTMKEFQSLRFALGPTFGLRQRMLHFIQNLVYYMMFEVIEPNWQGMEGAILLGKQPGFESGVGAKKGNRYTVDDVMRVHSEFLRRTLKECLLTNGDLIRTLTKLMTTCLLFSDQMKLFMETTQINEERNKTAMEERHKRQQNVSTFNKKRQRKMAEAAEAARKSRRKEHTERLERELNTESYKRMISRFNQVFNSNLADFMAQLHSDSDGRYHTYLSNLCTRLDFNGHITTSLNLGDSRNN